jgi:nucleoside diphosphate kinase
MSTANPQFHNRSTDFGFSFVKIGFEDKEESLVHDISEQGLELISRKRLVLPKRVVSYMYRDSLMEHFYPAMEQHLTRNPVTTQVWYGADGDTQQRLLDLKFGRNGRPNLRKKYQAPQGRSYSKEEIDLWYQLACADQDEMTIRLTQNNVFHTADSTEEAVTTIALLDVEVENYFQDTDPDGKFMGKRGLLLSVLEQSRILEV